MPTAQRFCPTIILWLPHSSCSLLSIIHASPEILSSFNWADFSFDEEVERYEKHLIALALKDSEGSVTNAAHMLNLSHQNLAAKIARYEEVAKFRKPVRQRRRRSIDSSEPTGSSPAKAFETTQTITILLVEDDQIITDAVKETLELKGWGVEVCLDGTAALDRIGSDAHYDLLLIDYELPGVNGIELVQQARHLAHRSNTPIIMLAATPFEVAALEAGADDFLPQPQAVSLLVETISSLLNDREQEA